MQIGKVGELEEVDEFRVEAICLNKDIAVKAIEELKKQALNLHASGRI